MAIIFREEEMIFVVKELVKLTISMEMLWQEQDGKYITEKNGMKFTVGKHERYDKVILLLDNELIFIEFRSEDYMRELYYRILEQIKAREILKKLKK